MGQFFWGAATSSHQVEGGNKNDWTEWEQANAERLAFSAKRNPPAGGWPEFILHPPAGGPSPLEPKNYISGKACDHYRRFSEDFDIAKSLGHNAHRFSLEWSRIEPEEGKFDEKEIAHYREVVGALRERGLEPFVTLWHWTLPLWLRDKGGTASAAFAKCFARYAGKMAEVLGADVRFWLTENEPEMHALNSYLRGAWPPGKRSFLVFYLCFRRLMRAHALAYRAIKLRAPEAQVGVAVNLVFFDSAGGFINNALARIARRAWNFHFLKHIRKDLDFIGLNYYFRNRINYGFNRNPNENISDMGWELYPEGIYHVLLSLKRFKKPVYVTENGLADARDVDRAAFVEETLERVARARREGADVRGYLHWSLLDNFEWDKGFWPRFGLVEVDYRTFARRIRPSARRYKELIKKGL